jgi:hypothetical protein
VVTLVVVLTSPVLPAGFAIALFRHGLYDIDRLINRTRRGQRVRPRWVPPGEDRRRLLTSNAQRLV